MVINALTTLADGIRYGGSQLIDAIGSVASTLTGNPMFGAVAGLVGAISDLFKKGGRALNARIVNVVRTFPQNLQLPLAANPASAVFGARGMFTGTGIMVQVDYAPGSENLVHVKAATGARWENELDGVR